MQPGHVFKGTGLVRRWTQAGHRVIIGSRSREKAQEALEDLRRVIPFDCIPVAVERVDAAIPLPDYTHPERAFYVFGPEDGDLGERVFSWCRDVVVIPSHDSINLAAAVNIVLYDRMAKRRG